MWACSFSIVSFDLKYSVVLITISIMFGITDDLQGYLLPPFLNSTIMHLYIQSCMVTIHNTVLYITHTWYCGQVSSGGCSYMYLYYVCGPYPLIEH